MSTYVNAQPIQPYIKYTQQGTETAECEVISFVVFVV
jgi:hypothetical protein